MIIKKGEKPHETPKTIDLKNNVIPTSVPHVKLFIAFESSRRNNKWGTYIYCLLRHVVTYLQIAYNNTHILLIWVIRIPVHIMQSYHNTLFITSSYMGFLGLYRCQEAGRRKQ